MFPAVHSAEWVAETRALLEPEFQRHFELESDGPFFQGAEGSGRVAVAPGLQAFEGSAFGQRLMESIVCHPMVLDFAQLVMGPFVQLDSCEVTGYPANADTHAPGAAWHRDGFDSSKVWSEGAPTQLWRPGTSMLDAAPTPKIVATRRAYTPPLACNYLTYLQDQDGTFDTAPLRVVPGSHRDYTHIPAEDTTESHPRELLVTAPAGSVVFTHCGVLHTGSVNRTDRTRFFVSCYVNRVGLPVRDVQQGALVDQAVADAMQRGDQRIV